MWPGAAKCDCQDSLTWRRDRQCSLAQEIVIVITVTLGEDRQSWRRTVGVLDNQTMRQDKVRLAMTEGR
jgi:hypothetical protein